MQPFCACIQVVQVYLSWPTPSPFPVPRLQLVSFTRLTLRRGDQKLVNLVVTAEQMAVWGDSGWTYIKGYTKISVVFTRKFYSRSIMWIR